VTRGRSPLDETRAAHLREDRDIDAEFEAHLAHRVDDLVAQGLSAEEADARAREDFGDTERLKAESRAVRAEARRRAARASKVDELRQDLAYALRQLRRGPGFALTALATITLGIGATATIVSVVNAVVLEPLPFEDPDRVVFATALTPAGERFSVAEPRFLDWREQARGFSGMAAFWTRAATLRDGGEPRSLDVEYVTHDLLDVLGMQPALGRMFDDNEDVSGQEAPVTLLSHDMWQSEYAGDPGVLGERLDLDGRLHEVIGVMPARLDVLARADLFIPMGPDASMDRDESYLTVVARLAPGVTLEGSRAELAEVQRRLGETYAADEGWSATVLTSEHELVGDTTVKAGWILLTAAGLLLVMASVNVSNLLLVRATARRVEIGLRAALGASRGRLARQLLTESAVLGTVGGALGVLFAFLALPAVRSMGEGRVPRLENATLDGTTLLASLACVAVATLTFGLAPAVQLRSRRFTGAVGTRRGSSDAGSRLRSTLVGAQVAMTVVLLAGTGLLLRSFVQLVRVDPGFNAEGTLAVRLALPDTSFASWGQRAELFPRLREAVGSLPGVVAVGATATDPFSGWNLANFIARADRMPDRAADFTPISWRIVTPGFFEAMGTEVRAGRVFTENDDWGELTPVVIGEALARRLWGAGDPVGQALVWGDPEGSRLLVVGVVEDVRDVRLADPPAPIIYRAYRQIPWPTMSLVVRVDGDPATVAAGIRARIHEVDPSVPVPEIASLEANLRRAVAEPRFNLELLASFAVVGLLLAVIGVYGLTAFDVRRRFREIGIRLSLGAEPGGVQSLILRQRMALTAAGVAVGLIVAWALTREIESLLYGITAHDPLTWAGVVAVVVGASGLAAYLPARRATKVDPTQVLGTE
jgi:putative ABC transport system permease protein